MAHRQNNNQRRRAADQPAPADAPQAAAPERKHPKRGPTVEIPNGSVPAEVRESYQAQYEGRILFEESRGGYFNVHATDALRRNVAECLAFDCRRAKQLAPRLAGRAIVVAPSTRVLAGTVRGVYSWSHAVCPAVMAEDRQRMDAIASLELRGDILDIKDWRPDLPPATRTYCRHLLQECTCHLVRFNEGDYFYSLVDVLLHIPPNTVYDIVARPGCTGLLTSHTVQSAGAVPVKYDGQSMIRHEVAGTGEFLEHDYRGFEAGGLWRMRQPRGTDKRDGVVITGVCEFAPDRGSVFMYVQAAMALSGRLVRNVGEEITVDEECLAECEVVTRGGDHRELRLRDRGQQLVVVTDAEALRIARRTQLPSGKTSTANAIATLKQALKYSGRSLSDADVNVLYAYAIMHAAHAAVPASRALEGATGVSILPAAIAAHYDALAGDPEVVDALTRLVRLRATRREADAGQGPTATAALALVGAAGAIALRRHNRACAGILAGASAALACVANWRQLLSDSGLLLKCATPLVAGLIAAGAVASLPMAMPLAPAEEAATVVVYAVKRAHSAVSAAIASLQLLTPHLPPDEQERFNAVVTSCNDAWRRAPAFVSENIEELVELSKDAVSALTAPRVASVHPGNTFVLVCVAPLVEEAVKRVFGARWAPAVSVALALIEARHEGLAPIDALSQCVKHVAFTVAPFKQGLLAHVLHNVIVVAWKSGRLPPTAARVVIGFIVWASYASAKPAATFAPAPKFEEPAQLIDSEYVFEGRSIEDVSPARRAAGVPIGGVCYTASFGIDPRATVEGNVLRYAYKPHGVCSAKTVGHLVGGVVGYTVVYPADCCHNANAGMVLRLLQPRPDGVEADERVIARNLAAIYRTPYALSDQRIAAYVREACVHNREDYVASLATRGLRMAAEAAHFAAAALPDEFKQNKLTYQVKVEKMLVRSPAMHVAGTLPKTPRAIIAPTPVGKELNAANHAKSKMFFVMAGQANLPLVKYEGTSEDCAKHFSDAIATARVDDAPGDLYVIRADVSKCDASQGPAACMEVRLRLAQLGVINFTSPPGYSPESNEATNVAYRDLCTVLDAQPDRRPKGSSDDEVDERTANAALFIRPRFSYRSANVSTPQAQVAGKMPSGVGWTSDGTTMLIGTIQAAAIMAGQTACGVQEPLPVFKRYVRGDDNFAIIAIPDGGADAFRRAFVAVFASVGMVVDAQIEPVEGGTVAVPLCSHIMYPCKPYVHDEVMIYVLPAQRIGRVLRHVLVFGPGIPHAKLQGAIRAAALDLMHNCGHVRLLRILAERLLVATTGVTEFVDYDRDAAYRITASAPARTRADDARCDDFIAYYYSKLGGVERAVVAASYQQACVRMATWQLGELFDGDFEQLAARVDS